MRSSLALRPIDSNPRTVEWLCGCLSVCCWQAGSHAEWNEHTVNVRHREKSKENKKDDTTRTRSCPCVSLRPSNARSHLGKKTCSWLPPSWCALACVRFFHTTVCRQNPSHSKIRLPNTQASFIYLWLKREQRRCVVGCVPDPRKRKLACEIWWNWRMMNTTTQRRKRGPLHCLCTVCPSCLVEELTTSVGFPLKKVWFRKKSSYVIL